jgi:hypothetical protein
VEQYRKIVNPYRSPVSLAAISSCPLYCLVFYSCANGTLYTYSINGQLLSHFQDPSPPLINMHVQPSTDFSESLVYMNGKRELYILELPDLVVRKKMRLKKDQFGITCF